jgi:hypothetical protein
VDAAVPVLADFVQGPESEGAAVPALGPTPSAELGQKVVYNDRMFAAFRQIDRARSLTEVLDVLADHAAAATGRVAILEVANSRLRVSAQRGLPGLDPAGIDVPLAPDTVFDLAVRLGRPVSTSEGPIGVDGDPLSAWLAGSAGLTGLAVPIVVGGRTVAILYTDHLGSEDPAPPGAWREPVELLARHAAWRLQVMNRMTGSR